jgi:hypothetical protein
MNKGGQFYLMAAIAVILVIVGLAVVPNSLKEAGTDNSKIYELFAEVNIDGLKMIGYVKEGEPTRYDEAQLKNILNNMTETYPMIEEIYILIYRKVGVVTAIKRYEYKKNGGVWALTDIFGDGNVDLKDVVIGDTKYNFYTSDNENFYYLIVREKNGHQYVTKG